MAEESAGSSRREQLSVCVRFVFKEADTFIVREEFLGFIACKSTKGSDITDILLSFLEAKRIDLNKLRGQCYDGASNMPGKFKGVQARIRERVPQARYVHCKSHCLNLALVHSSNIQCVRTMMATVQDIALCFDYSAKRLEAFASELETDAQSKEALDGRRKLRTLCETRWMSRADSLTTFKQAFRVVVHALETLHDDHDSKAGQYLAAILRFEFIVALVASEHILSSLVGLAAILQKACNIKCIILCYTLFFSSI